MGHRKADLCKPEPSFALFLFSQWENSRLATSGTGHQAEKQELGMDGQVFCVGAQQLCTHLYHRASKARSVFAGMKGEPRAPAHRSDFFSGTSDFHFIVSNCGLFRVLEIRQSFLTF